MSELTKKLDEKTNEIVRPFMTWLAFRMRDEAGHIPVKIRVNVLFKTEEGTHFNETEQIIIPEDFEEHYQKYISMEVLQQAKDIIDQEKKDKL